MLRANSGHGEFNAEAIYQSLKFFSPFHGDGQKKTQA